MNKTKNLENNLRKKLNRRGYFLRKGKDIYGLVGYMVVNSNNFVEYGYNGIATYTASLKDIAEFIKTI